MAKPVQIFADVSQGALFFKGTRIPTAPLGGAVLAVQNPNRPARIRVTREDQLQKDGVTTRRVYKRLEPERVKNKENQFLVGDLGFTQQQVIDYINDQATKKANEIDFQINGSTVGGGTTINFTGAGTSTVSVSGDVATVHITGGGGTGNPVTSGAIVGAGSTTLRLTLQDSSIRDIDVTSMRSTTSIGSSTAYFFLNNGVQLANNQHDKDGGVVFYGTKVRRGEELVFSIPSGPLHVGIWDGGNGVTGISNVSDKSNWSTKFRYSSEDTRWQNANTDQGKTGIDLANDVETDGGSYGIRFDYDSQKLQLWEIDTAFDWKIATANVALGVTETYIYFSTGSGTTQTNPPESLPGISTLRASEWTLESFRNAEVGRTIHTGLQDDDIWKSTRSLRPGMKLKTTLSGDIKLHHWGVGYGGTTGMGNGPQDPYGDATGSWRSSNSQEIRAEQNSSINPNYTSAVDTSTNLTLDLEGRNISWRYNSDNSWDLFDEDTDEVILTGDTNLDGSDMYPYLFGTSTINNYTTEIPQWEWEWNASNWFIEYRDYVSGGSGTTFMGKIPNAKPLKTSTQAIPTQSGGYYYLGNAAYRVTWGEKMRPGQEFSWTQLSDNSNGATKNNMIIGVLNTDSDSFTHGMKFYQSGGPKEPAHQDAGFTISAGITSAVTTAGASMRLKYEYGTNKLVCEKVEAGVRTKIAESTSALDGNPIFISLGGESTRVPTTQGVSVYGWECVHEPPNYYNPWKNWRIGGFPENQTSVGPGIHSTGGVLDYKIDQVWRHKDGIPAGYKMHWISAASQVNSKVGQWKSGNAISGLTNIENSDSFWDWSWETNTFERIDDVQGWSFNTSNSNYSATYWQDPNPGSTRISVRYHTNNTMDLYDESNNEVIITKNVTNDGNPIYLSWISGGNTNGVIQMNDDFFGGGDVGIALTSTVV